jgi:hypothetical protein
MSSAVGNIAKARFACLTATALLVTLFVNAAAPSLADDEKRWDKKACDLFAHVRKAHICMLDALQGFAPLANEPAQLIAEQSAKKCDWAWRDVYDREKPLLGPNANFDQYLKSWANQSVVLVLESRLPAGSPRPETDVQRDVIRIYTKKLSKDCGEFR